MAPRMFAEHQDTLGGANRFRPHDLVGGLVFEHAVLMNSGFVGESVSSNDCFVGLNYDTGAGADEFAHFAELGRVDMGQQMYQACLLYTSPSPRDRTRSR